MSRRPRASGHFRTGYVQDLALIQSRTERAALAALLAALALFPFLASPFLLDLANQVFLASIGSLALMLLTGYAGQVSLGHAGLMAAGAFTVGILFKEVQAPFWVALPHSTLDMQVADGVKEIPIEERSQAEVTDLTGRTADGRIETIRVAAAGSPAANPAFDVTPARLVTGLITERGRIAATAEAIAGMYPEKA